MDSTIGRRPSLLTLWRHHPLKVHIAALFMALLFIACGVIAWNNHARSKSFALSSARAQIDRISVEASAEMKNLLTPVAWVTSWLSSSRVVEAGSLESRMVALPLLADVLQRMPQLAAVYVGYQSGEFFLMRPFRDETTREALGAPRDAAFLVQSVERKDGVKGRYLMLDAGLNVISETFPPGYAYDPRAQTWYSDALASSDVVMTAPYTFFTTRRIGMTIARRAGNGQAVFGADVRLTQLSERLEQIRPTPSSQLAIHDAGGKVTAFSDPERLLKRSADGKPAQVSLGELSPILAAIAAEPGRFAETTRLEHDGRDWLVKADWVGTGAHRTPIAIATPLDELLAEANALLRRTVLSALAVILVATPLVWWISRRIAGNLDSLTEQAAAIRRFDFSDAPLPRTRINEIFGLGRAMSDMRQTIRRFLDITTALVSERNFERLLQRVLKEAHDAAGGIGGAIYLLDDEGRTLQAAAQRWDNPAAAGSPRLADLSMQDDANPVVAAAKRPTASPIHVLSPERPAGLEYVNAYFGAGPVMLVTVPLLNRAGEVIGVLCGFLPGTAEQPSAERLALVEAFAGAGAAAIDNQRLLARQKALLESFIGLVASAIDAKSPYTGGHCQRVPELTKMLARAACDAKEGPFAEFDISEDGWEALHIAGWLHDCGKVTTPEYVVDKATKLETIYDRIHEVRMRFEVLKRDAEIGCLKAIAAGGDAPALRAGLERELKTLDEEFAFVATCNEGGEFMAPEKIGRLKTIAARTWQRTLDDRAGVSWEEAQRMARTAAAALPATETLLADKPAHIIERSERDLMPDDNPWGFRLKVPAHLYNRGELYNLSIPRGTLSDGERFKINDHIVQTIMMLTKLPFPKHLKAVPELAGGHHEKLDGTGYPKRLSRGEMSVQARMMAIADIFEALTATDRPYKKGKKLSEAIKIMSFMKKDQHIDPELFELFLTSGVYLDYAKRYLDPRFIDTVDVASYVASPAPV